MKKFAMLLAALLLMMTVFAACGESKDAASGASQPGGAASSSEAAGEESAQPADTGDGDNTLVMATNAFFEPYEYYEGDDIVGIDAEVGKAIADKLGMDFEISDVDFDAIIPNVQSGKASMGMAGMTVTEDRQKNVNFTRSYATAVQVVIVPEGSDIAAIDDMAGKKIGVQQGTTGDIYCSAPVEEDGFGEENVTRYNKGTDAVMALLSGKVDCVVIDNEPAKAFVAANEGLKILDTAYAEEEYAICIAKDNEELLEKVDTALGELIDDGTVQKIVDKYITAE
ncbi:MULTISPECIES: transporter substrate-binding domain-containing protein [Eubacteriales]|jgi:ABC-type amino acid transport substrate-binding protein|uniref:transporter substrate-binding domain-containing protein n=1 Tax=Eubacteriales TaxID=186802 RepID=UPI001370798B|nr:MULTISPECIES: transporter substrate-binding domain-containing protein [unclassified Neglectibacter]MCI9116680.1 transporter substrate-binding domain-containing protein [Acutalibacter sp.]NBI17446.1 ABC transporter substrate-binding protein [Neglectibacter sp. 59]NBJ73616.1 ABC transporter substrate-binding protein [Neglectibacter sp. X4]NCE80566.1 ABC transporter substrate-binding protein [Neglectibacter sp. X58]